VNAELIGRKAELSQPFDQFILGYDSGAATG